MNLLPSSRLRIRECQARSWFVGRRLVKLVLRLNVASCVPVQLIHHVSNIELFVLHRHLGPWSLARPGTLLVLFEFYILGHWTSSSQISYLRLCQPACYYFHYQLPLGTILPNM